MNSVGRLELAVVTLVAVVGLIAASTVATPSGDGPAAKPLSVVNWN